MNEELDDGLTDQERAALNDEDGGDATTTDAEEGAGGDDGEGTKSPEDQAATGGDDADPAATKAADDGAAAATEAQPQPAPILIAPFPENVDAKLAEITSQKSTLLDQFDSGDLTAREYQTQLDVLAKQERQIERQQDRAEIAASMEQQRQQSEWTKTCDAFVDSHSVYKDMPWLYMQLDAKVKQLAVAPENQNWSGQKILDEAHKFLKGHYKLPDDGAKSERVVKPARELPPNLAKVPAADVEDTNGGRFSVLDRLANTDPIAYEETLNKMSASERDAYLAA